MRLACLLLLTALAASAQFKSTVPLVVSPVTVTDSNGRLINGLTVADLVIYDNSVAAEGTVASGRRAGFARRVDSGEP
jgi:hypothetical protein